MYATRGMRREKKLIKYGKELFVMVKFSQERTVDK